MLEIYVGAISEEAVEAACYADVAGICASERQVSPRGYAMHEDRLAALLAPTGVRMRVERDHWHEPSWKLDLHPVWNAVHLHSFTRNKTLDDALRRYDSLQIQVGPGEDDSKPCAIQALASCETAWLSFPIGPRVFGARNYIDRIEVPSFQHHVNTRIRMHNADYMPDIWKQIAKRGKLTPNIAPQLGAVQSAVYLKRALQEGVDWSNWLSACLHDHNQRKRWNAPEAEALFALGHYHYSHLSEEFRHDCRRECVISLVECIQRWA